MRVEIGEKMTIVDALEIIKRNNSGIFIAEGNKIYFDTQGIPTLPQQQPMQPQYYIPQQTQQTQPQRYTNAGSRMGDLLNEMCGIKR